MNISITIESILKVIEKDQLMMVQLKLNASWMDPGLEFRNLKEDEHLNSLTQKQRNSIWLPSLKFTNTLDKFVASFKDDLSKGVIKLNSNSKGHIPGKDGIYPVRNYKKYSGNEGYMFFHIN